MSGLKLVAVVTITNYCVAVYKQSHECGIG